MDVEDEEAHSSGSTSSSQVTLQIHFSITRYTSAGPRMTMHGFAVVTSTAAAFVEVVSCINRKMCIQLCHFVRIMLILAYFICSWRIIINP